jgi:hypothetical protein
MNSLSLPSNAITFIINNPSALRSSPVPFGISVAQAQIILSAGYNKGFKDIFYLNTALAVLAFVSSVVLIKHKELLRGDEERLKIEAKEALRAKGRLNAIDANLVNVDDIEMGPVLSQNSQK